MKKWIMSGVLAVGLSACHTKAQLIQESPILTKMVNAGAGEDPAQYTKEGLMVWFAHHPGMAASVVGERGRQQEGSEPYSPESFAVEQWERTVRGAAVDQITMSNAFGYVEPVVSGRGR